MVWGEHARIVGAGTGTVLSLPCQTRGPMSRFPPTHRCALAKFWSKFTS